MSEEAFIYEAIRTPRGKQKNGSLNEVKPINLVIGLIDELRSRFPDLDENLISDVILGVVSPVGDQGGDIARTAVLAAGLPDTTGGVQLNRFCASGLEAVNTAAQKVRSGWDDMVLAGGVESMSRVPMGSDGGAWATDPETNYTIGFVPQGIGADLIATIEGFSREDVDRYALRSQEKAAAAWSGGYFAKSVVPVKDQNGLVILDHDEHMRPDSTLEGLGKLKTAFDGIGEMGGFDDVALQKYHWVEKINHVHTGGNSSGIVDGAALVLVGSEKAGEVTGSDPAGAHRGHRHQRRRPGHHAHRPDPGHPQGARPRRPDRRRHRPVRAQRGVRVGGAEVPEGPEHPRREAQRQRWRHRDGPPAGRHRRHDHRHHGRRARAPQRPSRADHAVHRRRHGRGHHHRASLRKRKQWQRTPFSGTRMPTASSR